MFAAVEFNGLALAVIRTRSGLSQAELGRLAGVSQGHISQIESGDKTPRPAMAKRLADALGVPLGAFFSPSVLGHVLAQLRPDARCTHDEETAE